MANITFVNVYVPTNLTVGEFVTRLAKLEDTLRGISGDIVIGRGYQCEIDGMAIALHK